MDAEKRDMGALRLTTRLSRREESIPQGLKPALFTPVERPKAKALGYLEAKVLGYLEAKALGYLEAKVLGYLEAEALEYLEAKADALDTSGGPLWRTFQEVLW
jgi:hypothetical protein